MTQYHNLEDSGDPGPRNVAGASSHLVLAMVQLPDHTPIPELEAVRETFRLSREFEFKFYKATSGQKQTFFETVQKVPFRVRALILDKSSFPERLATLRAEQLVIELITGLTLRASPLDIANDVLIKDGGTPAFCQALRVRFSEECRKLNRIRPFSKIVGGRSRNEDGLQLADMIAGAIREYSLGESNFYSLFSNKIADLWQVSALEK